MVRPRLLAFTVVGTLVYFAVVVAAAGGPAAYFADPARTGLAAVLLALAVAALFTEGNVSPGEREDRKNRWVLAAFGVLGLLSAVVPPLTDRFGVWSLDGEAMRWTGVAVFAVGGALRLWPVFILGRRFSGLVAIQKDHALVTTGLYGVIRHPSYLGFLVGSIGWALAFRSGIGVILALLMIPPLVARMDAEEVLLASQFGDEYAAFRARTARMIPGIY